MRPILADKAKSEIIIVVDQNQLEIEESENENNQVEHIVKIKKLENLPKYYSK